MRFFVLIAALAAACSTRVDPSNGYDPGTPDEGKAKATVRGKLHATDVTGAQTFEVSLLQNNAHSSSTPIRKAMPPAAWDSRRKTFPSLSTTFWSETQTSGLRDNLPSNSKNWMWWVQLRIWRPRK